jgi:Ser-tRNA(Ala) deacylase AlaX
MKSDLNDEYVTHLLKQRAREASIAGHQRKIAAKKQQRVNHMLKHTFTHVDPNMTRDEWLASIKWTKGRAGMDPWMWALYRGALMSIGDLKGFTPLTQEELNDLV